MTTTQRGPETADATDVDWSAVSDITKKNGVRTHGSPAPVRFRGRLYLFTVDTSSAGTVEYCSSENGSDWSKKTDLTAKNKARSAGPLVPIVVFEKLFLLYRDRKDPSKLMLCQSPDGSEWFPPVTILPGGMGTSCQPVAVHYQGELYVFYRDEVGGLSIAITGNGADWQLVDVSEEIDADLQDELAAVGLADKLVVAYQRRGTPEIHTAYSTDGRGWRVAATVTDQYFPTSAKPVLCLHRGTLFAFYRYSDLLTVVESPDGRSWSKRQHIRDGNTRSRRQPAPVAYDNQLLLFFIGTSDNHHVDLCVRNDTNGTWGPEIRISERNHASADGELQVLADEFGLDVGYRSTNHDKAGLAAFRATWRREWSTRLACVQNAIRKIDKKGINETCAVDGAIFALLDHIQSMVPYRDWFLLPYNARLGNQGSLYILDRERKMPTRKLTIPERGLSHPGGAQVIGDYLAVALEDNGTTRGCVRFYDLSKLTDSADPKFLDLRVDTGKAANAVGITDIGAGAARRYVMGVYAGGEVRFYESNAMPLSDRRCQFTYRFSAETGSPGPDSMALLTDFEDNVYLLSLASGGSYKFDDWGILYAVDIAGQGMSEIARLPFCPQNTKTQSIHFRFGAGAEVLDENTIDLFASDRNFSQITDPVLFYNRFTRP
ncbi:exo-alpha-sialidase [Amycolatopsis sp. NPDC051061]|uniref:exo-alpha-sialidase n=1 Tax=Amycolatopsis sp. NPDC051061 TaxID=3155042 RepID=UPI003441DC72